MSKLTQFVHHRQIDFIHPNVFKLNSFVSNADNKIHKLNVSIHASQALATHPHSTLAYPMYRVELSEQAAALQTNESSNITTDPRCNYHNWLQVYSIDESILPRSEYHTIPPNSKVTLRFNEFIIDDKMHLVLTHLYLHKDF